MAETSTTTSAEVSDGHTSNCFDSTMGASANLSLDGNTLTMQMAQMTTFDITPSPSSIASDSTLDRSPKHSIRNLCSTLKGDISSKRSSRVERYLHQSQTINRRHMMTMANLIFQMQREIFQLKRRTRQMERLLSKQERTDQPVIRISRITQDQLKSLCFDNPEETSDGSQIIGQDQNFTLIQHPKANDTRNLQKQIRRQPPVKRLVNTSKQTASKIWVNHRQKPIDFSKYCHLCKREYAKRSNYLFHMRNIHKNHGAIGIDRNNGSVSEVELSEKAIEFTPGSDTMDDQSESVSTSPHVAGPMQRKIPMTARINLNSPPERRVGKTTSGDSYHGNQIKYHERLVNATGSNKSPSITSSSSRRSMEENRGEGNDEIVDLHSAGTPKTLNIADSDVFDEPIRFANESPKPIHLAVTCLETHQMEIVERFVKRFPTRVSLSPIVDVRTTHLVANDDGSPLRSPLSMKLIEAIARHCYCVSIRWVGECLKADKIIGEELFEIQGDNTEAQAHGGPRRSRLSIMRHALFNNICFMIKCTENSEVKMTNQRLEELITTCGGQIITCVTQRLLEQYTIIVLCDHQYVTERRHNYEQCRKLGINFVSSDWVLESILEYRQKPFFLFEETPE